ncbi:MAG: threonine synthase [Actinobacteria bacterium]|nr:threonine synthase [Actinomycetota bacterium]MCL5887106.1 threonine synthase [Actinomycetota bacterium]
MGHHTRYLDTRGLDLSMPTFSAAVVKGIAASGGLYVPDSLPSLSLQQIARFAEWPYSQRAAEVFKLLGVDLDEATIQDLMQRSYGPQWSDQRIAPVVSLGSGMHVLELWHGPTSAFKDMALQCMPLFFSASVESMRERGQATDDFLILVATSGDTGKAALDGFADRAHIKIAVFYPDQGVSDIQRKQMVTQTGENVNVFGVRGNFDDCQTAIKDAFADAPFNTILADEHGFVLSSANSINFGRLAPQIVYYISAYADLLAEGSLNPGQPMDVCVPTGNFGNILAAYYAKLMGVPIGRLVCASNENRVLADFIETGIYDIAERDFVTTPSPSMDILVSSNLERLLYHLAGPERVREWSEALRTHGRFEVDPDTLSQLQEHFCAGWVDNDSALLTIKEVLDESGYLMDPHTAVAWRIAHAEKSDNPMLVVSTAAWAKFGDSVLKAILGVPYSAPLPEDYARLGGVGMLKAVQKLTSASIAPIPDSLARLEETPERFTAVVDSGHEAVETAVLDWLRSAE